VDEKEKRALRGEIVAEIESQLFGPAGGTEEIITDPPVWRYLTGLLFPRQLAANALDVSEEPDVDGTTDETGGEGVSLSTAYDTLRSSMGLSFFVRDASSLRCWVEAARYEPLPKEGDREPWKRIPLASSDNPATIAIVVPPPHKSRTTGIEVFEGRAEMHAVFRPRSGGHLVTLTLVNTQDTDGRTASRYIEGILFQCRFRVAALDGTIGAYPRIARHSLHEEDEELAFTYRNRKSYGIGHGCAASWDPSDGPVTELTAESLPKQEVRGLTNEIEISASSARALSIQWLADEKTPHDEILDALDEFISEYETWIEKQERAMSDLTREERGTAEKIVDRQHRAAKRMRKGLSVLSEPASEVFEAFRLAQKAMRTQFLWVHRLQGETYERGKGNVAPIDVEVVVADEPTWRPFQLAFQLLALESMINPTSTDRSKLDLLWFPTGGGKTEAYLALSAMEILLRRLRYGDAGAGTAVLMRYTLRLLTAQQFERCATLVSVLEMMRKACPDSSLGTAPISLGLWVGGGTTPNQIDNDDGDAPGAKQLITDRILVDERPENPFQLLSCPHCGTRLVPGKKSPRNAYGVDIRDARLRLYCPDTRCILRERIPVSVVDEDLYADPPTIVIGTIDKFARMAWEPRSRALLGCAEITTEEGQISVLPPSLVIQDELHLITGPLGTITGMYEAAIDTVLRVNGIDAKYLAATATIQRAKAQCTQLYARDAFVFPAPGLDASDSFFSREDDRQAGRLYMGAMDSGAYGSLSMLVQASAAAAHSVQRMAISHPLDQNRKVAVDSYWTQVIYHNSRQELGKTTTLLRDDVDSRLKSFEPNADKRRDFGRVVELSANLKSGAEVSGALERLKIEWSDDNSIDILACTNMISVGVDVARLGLMIVKGQPKTTSEYIQATSRVGRSGKRPPGLVLSLFASTRPRDRSHFETFQQYHQALYRAVEPSSVTPFAPPALDRTLHAAIVLCIRHVQNLASNDSAANFDKNEPKVREVLEILIDRIATACLEDGPEELRERFWQLVETWHEEALASNGRLRFREIQQFPGLMSSYEHAGLHEGPPWPTLNSMRHVDGEAPIATSMEAEG
jgi:hypothetical protein